MKPQAMSIPEAVLRNLRDEFHKFNESHGRIGVVLFCELCFPHSKLVHGFTPTASGLHVDSPEFRVAEFPAKPSKPGRLPAEILRDLHERDGRTERTFSGGPTSTGCISWKPRMDESASPVDANTATGPFATSDGLLALPGVAKDSQQACWWLTGVRFELRYFVQGSPTDLKAYLALEKLATNSLKQLIEPLELVRWCNPVMMRDASVRVASHLWTEMLFHVAWKPGLMVSFDCERRIATAKPLNRLQSKWTSLPRRTASNAPIPAKHIPTNWYAVLTDVATASTYLADVFPAIIGELTPRNPNISSTVRPPQTMTDEAEQLETICGFLNSPLHERIVRFLWDRKHKTGFDTLRSSCWDGSDVLDETIKRTCSRISERLASHLAIHVSTANRRVSLEIFPPKAGK